MKVALTPFELCDKIVEGSGDYILFCTNDKKAKVWGFPIHKNETSMWKEINGEVITYDFKDIIYLRNGKEYTLSC